MWQWLGAFRRTCISHEAVTVARPTRSTRETHVGWAGAVWQVLPSFFLDFRFLQAALQLHIRGAARHHPQGPRCVAL